MAFQKVGSFPLPVSLPFCSWEALGPLLLFPKGGMCPAVTEGIRYLARTAWGLEARLLQGDDSFSIFRTDQQKLSVL